MRTLSKDEIKSNTRGKVIVIYSDEAGAGKTTSCIRTMPQPINVIYTEDRNVLSSIEAIYSLNGSPVNRKDYQSDQNWRDAVIDHWTGKGNSIVIPESHDDFLEYLDKSLKLAKQGKFPYKSILIDSLGYWMNIELTRMLEDESYHGKVNALKSGETIRELTEQVQMDQRAYGSLGGIMNRYMKLIKPFTQENIMLVMIFQGDTNPSYNKSYSLAPLVKGRVFGNDLKGHVDFCGVARKRHDENGNVVFPPYISFEMDNAMIRWCGSRVNPDGTDKQLTDLKFDFRKIFPECYEEINKKEDNGKGK